MTESDPPICLQCQHFKVPPLKTKSLTCKAFPDGIPDLIVRNEQSHINPIEGDNGFQFKELTGKKLKARQKAIRDWLKG